MKIGKTKLSQKILIVIFTMLLLFNFITPVVKADAGGALFKPIQSLVTALGDSVIWIMQYAFYGNTESVVINPDNSDEILGGLFYIVEGSIADKIRDWASGSIEIPRIKLSPESIFSNKIPAFDINFFNPSDGIDEERKEIEINTVGKFVDALEAGYISFNGNNGSTYYNKAKEILTTLAQKYSEIDVDYIMENNKSTGVGEVLNHYSDTEKELFAEETGYANVSGEITNEERKSSAWILQSTVSYWYNILRNISIIGLLSVLVYIGIRIVTSSAATDKSKYKEMLKDWVVALCLLFFMHYFMNFVVTVTSSISEALDTNNSITSEQKTLLVGKDGEGVEVTYYGDELIGNSRLQLQSKDFAQQMGYTIIYAVLVIYTFYFALMYLKRVIYMAFFTMIAPLVALTYPLDKIRDGKAQAFDFWIKEYVFNALIQPFHLIIYYVLVSSSISLAKNNPIYALAAIGFMLPAEKILRKFFGFDKASTAGALGGVLGGAMVMQGINALTKRVGSGGKGKTGAADANGKQANKPVRTANSGNNTNSLMTDISGENPSSDSNVGDRSNSNTSSRNLDDQEDLDASSYDGNEPEVFTKQGRMDELESKLNEWEEANNMSAYSGPDDIRAMQEEYAELAHEKAMFEQQGQEEDDASEQELPELSWPEEEGDPKAMEEEIARQDAKRFARAVGGTALRYTAKGALGATKLAAKGIATGTLGTIGVAAGLASEDYSNVFKWGVAGAAAGNLAANAAMRKIPSTAYRVKSALEAERDRFEQDAFSKDRRKQIVNKRADDAFLRDKQAIRQYKDAFEGEDVKKVMQDAIKYRDYGITDNDTIIKAMKLKTKGIGDRADKRRILVAKTASQLNRKDVDAFGDRLRSNKFSKEQAENMKQAIRDFNDWE